MKKRWITILNLKKLTELERIAKAREIINKMEGNAWFPDPNPSLADLEAQADTTQTAYDNSRDAGSAATATFHNELDELERLMLKQVNYVEDVANDNEDEGDEIILSAGMEFRDQGAINIQDFSVKNAKVKGSVDARIKAQKPRTIYLWDVREVGETEWTRVKVTVQARYTFTGLTSKEEYEFRGGYQLAVDNEEVYFDPISLVIL